jgi:deoxycytidylate deaminase
MKKDYPYLPEGRNIKYVPVSNPFMAEARRMQELFSNERNHPTGAVVVNDGKILGQGANQAPIKNKKLIELHKNGWCIRRMLNVPSGQRYWLCPGCASCKQHAETRAVNDAISKNGGVSGADLYLYGHWWCCKPCWDSMIKAGIKDVYLVDNANELFKK